MLSCSPVPACRAYADWEPCRLNRLYLVAGERRCVPNSLFVTHPPPSKFCLSNAQIFLSRHFQNSAPSRTQSGSTTLLNFSNLRFFSVWKFKMTMMCISTLIGFCLVVSISGQDTCGKTFFLFKTILLKEFK